MALGADKASNAAICNDAPSALVGLPRRLRRQIGLGCLTSEARPLSAPPASAPVRFCAAAANKKTIITTRIQSEYSAFSNGEDASNMRPYWRGPTPQSKIFSSPLASATNLQGPP